MVLLLVSYFSYYSYSDAQDIHTTPNVIQSQGWQGCLDQHPGWIWGGAVGGPCPVRRAGDGAILFSHGQSTISQTHAVNQALSGTGIQIRGYQYGWTVKNANAGGNQAQPYDPLNINVSLYDSTNTQVLETRNYNYSYRINDWTTFSGTEDYANRYSLASVGNITLSVTSRDVGSWVGYYGPEINNVSLRLRYSVDVCAANPLSSPECPGYQQAYFTQQCSANPLYNSGCPGYTEAYFQLQCSSNPLYNPACPGYQVAYFTQQCSANPLFNPECPGYQQAYFNQQCTRSPLYNQQCPGYQQAYFDQQCKLSPLYNQECPGYQQAYFNQQCSINIFYNSACPGYEQAYFAQQCNLNQLWRSDCPGYQQAYLTQQCNLNQLYSTSCPLYQQAFFNQQCQLNTLYNSQCPGYQVAYQEKLRNDACRANPQSSPSCPGYTVASSSPVIVTVSTTTAVQPQDPVAAATETPLTADPIVNQALAATRETASSAPANTANANNAQPLGTGITVPGMRLQPPTNTRSTNSAGGSRDNRSRAAAVARSATTAGEAVARDAQTQQQDAAMAQMANVPGFDTYQSARIADAPFYQPRDIYRGVVIRDNARAQRALSQRSDRLHQEMINEQYR